MFLQYISISLKPRLFDFLLASNPTTKTYFVPFASRIKYVKVFIPIPTSHEVAVYGLIQPSGGRNRVKKHSFSFSIKMIQKEVITQLYI